MLDPSRELLRHALATVAYRGGKALRGAPPGFDAFRAAPGSRCAGEILAHLGDLLDWSLGLIEGVHRWQEAPPGSWEEETARFYAGLSALDARLAAGEALKCRGERLFQGPIADALTHVGQLTLLRRLAGAPVRGENYFQADIVAGRLGAEQGAPRKEFD